MDRDRAGSEGKKQKLKSEATKDKKEVAALKVELTQLKTKLASSPAQTLGKVARRS